MPDKKEKKQDKEIVNRNSMTGAMKKALSKVGDTMNSPLLPEGNMGPKSNYYPFGADTPVLGQINFPDISQMYDNIRQYSSPMNMAAMAMMARPNGNLQQIGENIKQGEQTPLSAAELPPEMVAPGMEEAYNTPRRVGSKTPGMSDQQLFDLARQKFNMGQDLPTQPVSVSNPSFWWTNHRRTSYGN